MRHTGLEDAVRRVIRPPRQKQVNPWGPDRRFEFSSEAERGLARPKRPFNVEFPRLVQEGLDLRAPPHHAVLCGRFSEDDAHFGGPGWSSSTIRAMLTWPECSICSFGLPLA